MSGTPRTMEPVHIVTRAEWGAEPPTKKPHAIATPTPRLWLHHTAGNERGKAGMRNIQRFHQETRGWSDIAYSLVVDPDDLTIYEARGIGIAGGHTKGDNTHSHAICVMGNFDNEHPSPGLLRLLADLIRHGRGQGWWGDLTGGHRNAPGASTSCPGRHLQAAIPEIRTLSNATLPEDDDMPSIEEIENLLDRKLDEKLGTNTKAGQNPGPQTVIGRFLARIEEVQGNLAKAIREP